MERIGGSSRVRDELSTALAEGRGVTAKVRWVSRVEDEGRNRWIHCTPLLGSNGQIGVWMVVLVDDTEELSRRWKQAPPVAPHRGKVYGSSRDVQGSGDSLVGGGNGLENERPPRAHQAQNKRNGAPPGSVRSTSPNSVLI